MENVLENTVLDYEWVELIKEAKTMGMTLEDVRRFFAEMRATT